MLLVAYNASGESHAQKGLWSHIGPYRQLTANHISYSDINLQCQSYTAAWYAGAVVHDLVAFLKTKLRTK